MKSTATQLETTRRAILDALAHTIVESKALGFSVQEVADRAGVTHRTVYNHFPTRDAMSEGLADYVEELLSTLGPVPDREISLDLFPRIVGEIYRGLVMQEVLVRAYVILMIANRRPTKLARARLRRFEETIARDAVLPTGLSARQVSAAIRMFVSSLGWHTFTEHYGLSSEQAAATASWATRTLIEAVERRGHSRAKAKPRSRSKSRFLARTEGGTQCSQVTS